MNEFGIDVELLICMIRDQPALWDKTYEYYKNKNHSREAWIHICAAFRPDFQSMGQEDQQNLQSALQKKWTYIRDSWIKWKKKSLEKTDECKTFTDAEIASFLRNILFNGESECNGLDEKSHVMDEKSQELSQVTKVLPEQPCQSTPVVSHIQKIKAVKRKAADCENDMPHSSTMPNTNSLGSRNRHLLFFKGILPSLESFSDDETLEFQIGVLNLIQSIRARNNAS